LGSDVLAAYVNRAERIHLEVRHLHGTPEHPGQGATDADVFAALPWAKIDIDLCDDAARNLLVVSDYYSNYIEVEHLGRAITNNVMKALKIMFSRFRVPDMVVSNNGSQFSSVEFAEFAKNWSFEHITSSPHYPQF